MKLKLLAFISCCITFAFPVHSQAVSIPRYQQSPEKRSEHDNLRQLQARTPMQRLPLVNRRKKLENPPRRSESPVSARPHASGSVTAILGAGPDALVTTKKGSNGPSNHHYVEEAKPIQSQAIKDPVKTRVSGDPGGGSFIEAEGTAKRVKVAMKIGPNGLASTSQKRPDGSWGSPERYPVQDGFKKTFQNPDGSPVTVKASLWGVGGMESNNLVLTSKMYDKHQRNRK